MFFIQSVYYLNSAVPLFFWWSCPFHAPQSHSLMSTTQSPEKLALSKIALWTRKATLLRASLQCSFILHWKQILQLKTDFETEFWAECLLGNTLQRQTCQEVRKAGLDRGTIAKPCNQDFSESHMELCIWEGPSGWLQIESKDLAFAPPHQPILWSLLERWTNPSEAVSCD